MRLRAHRFGVGVGGASTPGFLSIFYWYGCGRYQHPVRCVWCWHGPIRLRAHLSDGVYACTMCMWLCVFIGLVWVTKASSLAWLLNLCVCVLVRLRVRRRKYLCSLTPLTY